MYSDGPFKAINLMIRQAMIALIYDHYTDMIYILDLTGSLLSKPFCQVCMSINDY